MHNLIICTSCNSSYSKSYYKKHINTIKHKNNDRKINKFIPSSKKLKNNVNKTTKNGARQQHGFDFENFIINKYNMIKCNNYTSIYDAYTTDNDPVQIKYIQYNTSIELGDIFRNSSKNEDFLLIIGFWKWDKNKRNKIHVITYQISIDHIEWSKLFLFDYYDIMKTEMNLITNLKIDDDVWSEYRKKYSKLWNTSNQLISIRFKRDHKTQKRIQCAINQRSFRLVQKIFVTIELN